MAGDCCPGERQCDDGQCLPAGRCCPGAIPPLCGACEEVVCNSDELYCRPIRQCAVNEKLNPTTCQCECPPGSVLLADEVTCCPPDRACNFNGAGRATICCSAETFCVAMELCS